MAYFVKLLGARTVRLKIDSGDVLTVGRAPGVDLRLDDKLVSREHCLLQAKTTGLEVRDLDSRNGTRLNGRRFRGEILARPGDQVRVGSHLLLVELEGEGADSSGTHGEGLAGNLNRPSLPSLPGYEFLTELGRGSTGRVYRARSLLKSCDVAVKVLARTADETTVKRFQRAAGALKRLDHPNIVNVFEVEAAAGVHYYTMEFLQGARLSRMVAKRALGVREAISIVVQVARALKLVHQEDVIHRDVNPGNVMVLPGRVVKLLGFGFAKSSDHGTSASLTGLGEMVGELAYTSPEQARDPREVDHRADLYGLGAVLFEAVAGRPPFEGKNHLETMRKVLTERPQALRRIDPNVPESIDRLVGRLLEKDPNHRYQTAAEVEHALEEALLEACATERERSEDERSFGGGFSGPELLEIVQFLELHQKDGRLVISAPPLEGEVIFRQGKIVGSLAGQLEGEQAANTLLDATEGTFRFQGAAKGDKPVDMGISLSPSVLAIDVLRRRDERHRR